jgi:hypothetical protein
MEIKPNFDSSLDTYYCECEESIIPEEQICPGCGTTLIYDYCNLVWDDETEEWSCVNCDCVNIETAGHCKNCGSIFLNNQGV